MKLATKSIYEQFEKVCRDFPGRRALVYLGMISNFIGRAGEMQTNTAALAEKLAGYFLKGAGL